MGHQRYRPVETCGLDSFCQIIIVGLIENIVPREAIENALSPNLQALILSACENQSITPHFYQLRLEILLRYTQVYNSSALTYVPNDGCFYVNCNTNINFVITMLLQEVPVFQERYESCPLGHQSYTRARANLGVSLNVIRDLNIPRLIIPSEFSTVDNTQCSERIAEGFRCPARRGASLVHAGKYSQNCDSYRAEKRRAT